MLIRQPSLLEFSDDARELHLFHEDVQRVAHQVRAHAARICLDGPACCVRVDDVACLSQCAVGVVVVPEPLQLPRVLRSVEGSHV